MELSIDHITVTPIKLFSNNTPPPIRRLQCYVEPDVYEEILGIAHHEGIEMPEAIRQLLSFALLYYQHTREIAQTEGITLEETITDLISHAYRYYKYRQGTLNPTVPANAKVFFCQVCGNERKVRQQHSTKILNEEYKFCEDCFFADKHKPFIVTLLNRA